MKKILLLLFLNSLTLLASAQNIYICKDGIYTKTSISEGLEIDLSSGIDSITFSKPDLLPTVKIVYAGTTATVTIPDDISKYVTCSSGTSSNVVLTNTNTTDEYAYVLSGSSSDGSFTINGDYKLTVKLNGLTLNCTNLECSKGTAINIQCGKRIDLILADGTTNTLSDEGGIGQATLFTKGHMEISGGGTLNINAVADHGIETKEYLLLKKSTGTLNISTTNGDAIHVKQYYQQNGGTVNIPTLWSDGIDVEYKTDDDDVPYTDEENTGSITINDGTINMTLNGNQDKKGLKSVGDIHINGGTFDINVTSSGSRGIQTDGNMTISEDNATTTMTITAGGGKCTIDSHKSDPHKCMGIKVDGNLTISGGTVTVYNTGNKAKGIKVDGTYTKTGGTVTAALDVE